MVRVLLSESLARVAGRSCFQCEQPDVPTVKFVLKTVISQSPDLEQLVLDSTGGLDAHTAVFVGSASLRDRVGLSDEAPESCTLHVMRSLGPPFGMCWSSDWREHRSAVLAAAIRDRKEAAGQRLAPEFVSARDRA